MLYGIIMAHHSSLSKEKTESASLGFSLFPGSPDIAKCGEYALKRSRVYNCRVFWQFMQLMLDRVIRVQ
jgi:hypothetical protein